MAILSGYKRVCRRNIGGVSRLGVVPIQNIDVTIMEKLISEITFKEGATKFADYESVLDGIEYKISESEQTVTLRFNALDAKSSIAYNELLDAAPCGLALLLHMNNGAAVLVGWTEEFGNHRPVTDVTPDGTSGKAITDDNYLDITFRTTQVTAPLYLSEEAVKKLDTYFEAPKV